jgi:hypothetical protein
MASKHPYISSNVALTQVLDYLRKSFPSTFNSETLKKLSLAPGNESYILNILRFLNFIDENDSRTDVAHSIFTLHDDGEFQAALSKAIQKSYSDLFSLHNEATWLLPDDKLIPFFRQTDKTTELVGTRQANTFRTLSAYSGHAVMNIPKGPRGVSKGASTKPSKKVPSAKKQVDVPGSPRMKETPSMRDVGLTVRIEINLPATGDQDTYDKIFKSIRENFLNVQ